MSRATRSVLITGASRGIGRATALHLARARMFVLAGVRSVEDGESLEAQGNGRIKSVLLDVTSDESVAAAAQEAERLTCGAGLDGLVNNAGVGGTCPLEHVTRGQLEQQFQVNLFGVVLTTKAVLPLLRTAKGRIVNVGAANARLAIPLVGVLSSTKFALEGMTDALRVELRRSGIRVCLVEPGMTYADADKPRFAKRLAGDLATALQAIPEEHWGYYQSALERARDFNRSMLERARPPERVAWCIGHALTAPRPRARYWCGLDGKLACFVGLLAPPSLRDALWRRITEL